MLIPQNTAEGVRNYAIVLTFLDTGIRLSELLNLKISDIDFSLGQFKVFGKGAKERLVPMGYATRRAILRYRDTARPQLVNPNETRRMLSSRLPGDTAILLGDCRWQRFSFFRLVLCARAPRLFSSHG